MKKVLLMASAVLLTGTAVQAQEAYSQMAKQTQKQSVIARERAAKMNAATQFGAAESMQLATLAERASYVTKRKANVYTGASKAFYYRPAGSFYLAMSQQGYSYSTAFLYVPPVVASTYTAANQNASNYTWNVQLYNRSAGGRVWLTGNQPEASVAYSMEEDSVPNLTVDGDTYFIHKTAYDRTTQAYSHNYGFVEANNDLSAELLEYNPNAGTWYVSPKYLGVPRDESGQYPFTYYSGASLNSSDTQRQGYWFGKNYNGLNGLAIYAEQPEHPYALRGVGAYYGLLQLKDKKVPATLRAIVYKATKADGDSLVLGDIVAQSTVSIDSTYDSDGGIIPFTFKDIDAATGIETDVTPTIDFPIAVVITGYNDNDALANFTMCISTDPYTEGYGGIGYAMIGNRGQNDLIVSQMLNTMFSNGSGVVDLGYVAPSIFFDVARPYMLYNWSNETGERTFPAEGGKLQSTTDDGTEDGIEVFSQYGSDEWSITTTSGDEVPDWISLDFTDGKDNSGDYSGLTTITGTVAAIPAGQTGGRRADIRFAIPGNYVDLVIRQNDASGVEEKLADGGLTQVRVANDQFVVNAGNAKNVNIYNVAGKLVRSSVLSGGTAVIDASGLANGVYVLRFNTGKTVKVVK